MYLLLQASNQGTIDLIEAQRLYFLLMLNTNFGKLSIREYKLELLSLCQSSDPEIMTLLLIGIIITSKANLIGHTLSQESQL